MHLSYLTSFCQSLGQSGQFTVEYATPGPAADEWILGFRNHRFRHLHALIDEPTDPGFILWTSLHRVEDVVGTPSHAHLSWADAYALLHAATAGLLPGCLFAVECGVYRALIVDADGETHVIATGEQVNVLRQAAMFGHVSDVYAWNHVWLVCERIASEATCACPEETITYPPIALSSVAYSPIGQNDNDDDLVASKPDR